MNNQEISLLLVFDTIMTEGSVTRAADRLCTTQPAVSNAISRMRHLWKDPVFVKHGRQIKPTAFAENLWRLIRRPMFDLSNAIAGNKFDPQNSNRQFRIAIDDCLFDMLTPTLICALDKFAPGVNLHVVSYSMEPMDSLRQAQVDLIVGISPDKDKRLRSVLLFESPYIVAMREGHPLASRDFGCLEYMSEKQVFVSFSCDSIVLPCESDNPAAVNRCFTVSGNQFSTLPNLLKHTNMIATVPSIVTRRQGFSEGIVFRQPPFYIERTQIHLIWHCRNDLDSGVNWMHRLISDLIRGALEGFSDDFQFLCELGGVTKNINTANLDLVVT